MRKRRVIFVIAAALMLGGCYTVRYTYGKNPDGAHHEEGATFFLWGLVGEKMLNLDTICPQGVARWQNQATFLDGFLSVITLGIYEPRTITVECAAGRAYRLTPDEATLLAQQAGNLEEPRGER